MESCIPIPSGAVLGRSAATTPRSPISHLPSPAQSASAIRRRFARSTLVSRPSTESRLSAFSSSAIRHQSSALGRRAASAFTLIELLIVIAIIGILAGLILAAMGGVQKRGTRAKAESDIQALSASIEEYYRDFRAYPSPDRLYAELTTDGADTNRSKVYIEPRAGLVSTNGSQKFFSDPWGEAYEYTTNAAGFFEILSRGGSTNSNQFIRN